MAFSGLEKSEGSTERHFLYPTGLAETRAKPRKEMASPPLPTLLAERSQCQSPQDHHHVSGKEDRAGIRRLKRTSIQ
jgi:hypothetical protein